MWMKSGLLQLLALLLSGQELKITIVPNQFEQLFCYFGHVIWHIFSRLSHPPHIVVVSLFSILRSTSMFSPPSTWSVNLWAYSGRGLGGLYAVHIPLKSLIMQFFNWWAMPGFGFHFNPEVIVFFLASVLLDTMQKMPNAYILHIVYALYCSRVTNKLILWQFGPA